MNLNLKTALVLLFAAGFVAHAQAYSVKAVLQDSQTAEPVGFATVSVHNPADGKGIAYELSDEKGSTRLNGLKPGKYLFRAEILGYKKFEKNFEIKDADVDLGTIKMRTDATQLEAARVTDRGNPIQMKRDTMSFTASTFKTTDNDMLEDLLKKIPGMEVSEDGTITHNGKEITKITIDGKTFFLNDPQIATKNLPAKIVDKLRVVEKKSDQAEFTGIDDGEEETILDLSVKPGMMNGVFGNVMGGAGHDIPSTDITGDWRWQTGGFVGNFTDKYQLSGVFNANNTNNRGFNDLAGSMMGQNMGGGGMGRGQGGWGGGNGITTSYMAGLNGGTNLFDDKMELSGNYAFNGSERYVEETSDKTTHLEDSDLLYHSSGNSTTGTHGNRFGMRMEHKFSDNTSLIFEPRINFGGGSYYQKDTTSTDTYDLASGLTTKTNDSHKDNSGANKNLSASGFALLRQKLAMPGQTLTVMGRYAVSQNKTVGKNISETNVYDELGAATNTAVNQNYTQEQNSYSGFARATFTQPLVENLYLEANAAFNWSKSTSDKATTDALTGAAVDSYSNHITNDFTSEEVGANLLYQKNSFRAQLGFAVIPSKTHNYTESGSAYKVDTTITRLNWSPTAMLYTDLGENGSARIFYRGRSQTPSTSQLITVADNSNPLAVSFGNPNLAPYFSHNLWSDLRFNNKKTFASVNARLNGTYTQDPIVNAHWYTGGVTYSMPVNGPSSYNLSGNVFANLPIGKTKFTFFNMLRASYSSSSSYVGTGINTDKYLNSDGSLDYNLFFADYNDIRSKLTENNTKTLSITERVRLTYRTDALELQASARTRMSHSNYALAETTSQTTTWNNVVSGNGTWTLDGAGLSLKGELEYHWYRGYVTAQPDEYVFNAEISQQILKKKATLALKGYDIFGQAKNLTVSDSSNIHTESVNNTLGRYVILSFTYRFGNFDRSKMRGPGGRPPGR